MKCELLSAVVLKEVSSPYHIKEINNQAVPWSFSLIFKPMQNQVNVVTNDDVCMFTLEKHVNKVTSDICA